ncbi:unnamed protein product [Adineta steineri]|uniref:Ras GTPase-activating protein n=1 Tax=Adineta steineri TaxID=433720 RepID=A0A813QJW6_9BILA|nr:unnamed protein product [Adineta steineri]
MRNNQSLENLYGWFDVSNNFNNQHNWNSKYIELNQSKRTLTFYSDECIRSTNNGVKPMPTINLNYETVSVSSSSSSSSSLYKTHDRRTSINVFQANSMLPTLSELITPSLSKTLSSSIVTDEKIKTIYSSSLIDSSPDRPSSISIPRQSRIKFSHFFARSSNHLEHFLPTLKRTKSVTKLERQKHLNIIQNQQSLLNIPSTRSRSHESLFISNGPLGSILPSKPAEIMLNNCHIRRLHPSIISSSNLNNSSTIIEIQNKNKTKICYLRSKENSVLLKQLQNSSLKNINHGLRIDNSLDIWILEAKGLPTKKNCKYYIKIFLDNDIYGKTTNIERRDALFWGENFIFKDLPEGCSTLQCKLYIERHKQKQHDIEVIGYVDIPLSTIIGNQFIERWYPIQIGNTKEKIQDGSVTIRIKTKYQTIEILTIDLYFNLQEYIRQNYLQLIEILEPNISLKDKDEIATSLTRIAQSLSYSIPYLVDIIQAEILSTSDNSLTFRGNSIATKSMESYMKLIGETYLHKTLTHFIIDIILSKNFNDIELEVDPDRIINIENLEKNQLTLKLLCEQIWLEIQQSYISFPHELKYIFWKLRQLSLNDETIFNFLSGSVFLRFLCPAILSPNLFGLTQEYPSEKASRKLTLIAKTLQTLANFSKFGSKESYMKFMNSFVSKESDNMRRFFIKISTIDSNESEIINDDIDLGREYAILHTTLTNLFVELDMNIRESLNELESILNELSNKKSQNFNQNYSSPHNNQRSVLETINPTPQDHHLEDSKTHSYQKKEQLTVPLYFINNLSTEYSSQQAIDRHHESLQQPLLVSNNSSMNKTTQNLASSNNNNTTVTSNPSITSLKTDEQVNKIQPQIALTGQYLPPKMGVKAFSHSNLNKNLVYPQYSPMFNVYQEEKYRRIECENKIERFRLHESDV